jgi:hypothetical protein
MVKKRFILPPYSLGFAIYMAVIRPFSCQCL